MLFAAEVDVASLARRTRRSRRSHYMTLSENHKAENNIPLPRRLGSQDASRVGREMDRHVVSPTL